MKNFDLKQEIANLPTNPGVYLMHNAADTIIYVGKAVNLKNRVTSYFRRNAGHTPKVLAMVEKIAYFEYIITDTELEALILECNLIKLHKPQYNILLKDDKGYPYIRISMQEEYPKITLARKKEKDGAKYFGPFYSNVTVNETIDAIQKIFPLKSCNKVLPRDVGKERPCLNFHIGRCIAPCQGGVNKEAYRSMMQEICTFLNGHMEDVLKKLEAQMLAFSERLEFERAAELRNKIQIIHRMQDKQKMTGPRDENIDVLGIAQNEVDSCIQIFFIRDGRTLGRDFFILEGTGTDSKQELVSAFIQQFYEDASFIPKTVLLPEALEDAPLLETWLTEKRESKVECRAPQRGDKLGLVKMACANAELQLRNFSIRCKGIRQKDLKILEQFRDLTGMDKIPARIEAYDVSNTGLSENVASMVVFENGKPNKKEYRRFQVKMEDWKGDVESMRHVLQRRLAHEEIPLPDVILADGGELHANMVKEVLQASERQGTEQVYVFGMVKDDRHRTRGLIAGEKELDLKQDLELFRFVTAIQDEAHRFAITYNKKLRDKRYTKSSLDDIPGIGKKRKLALLKAFGSLAKIKNATEEELMKVEGISQSIAQNIVIFWEQEKQKK